MQKRFLLIFILFFSLTAFSQQLNIIPQPVSAKRLTGEFKLSKKTVIAVQNEEDKKAALFFNNYLKNVYGFTLDIDKQEGKDYIRLKTSKALNAETDSYTLQVTGEGVTIEGATNAGTFYGVQTLIQLLEPYDFKSVLNSKNGISVSSLIIPAVTIEDYPRFNYRGMHLDVARHFQPISYIKKYIDYLALHKMNFFHWHLTDDQGWRIPITRYPKLTEIGGYRNGTIVGRFPGTGNDNQRYGGFYTHDEIKEMVQYAMERYITVVPEIEMPGHASAAIAAYPWLSCFPEKPTVIAKNGSLQSAAQQKSGGAKLVQETWGIFSDVFCAGNDSTFNFLQTVLDEVLQLFPSKHIHVGGDESPKAHWKICPRCQARIKKEGLKDEHELQSYFIQRMEKYLNDRGRILIGWDEILEGGLAPNAVVMSWRGESGGIAAAKQKHTVIMTPSQPVYFDYTQTKNEDSVTIGGYNPLQKVYDYEPVPKELSQTDAKYIWGAQANLWTEYIKYPGKIEYMIFPRMTALSEVLWSPKESRNWNSFERRLQSQFQRYGLWGANYSKAYFDLTTTVAPLPAKAGVQWNLKNSTKKGIVIYTTPSGKTKTAKGDSVNVLITQPGTYTAWIAERGTNLKTPLASLKKLTSPVKQTFKFSKTTGKNITVTTPPNEKYAGQGGAFSLINGVQSSKGLSNPDWLGWIGDDLEAMIDFGKKETFTTVKLHTLDQTGSWVYLPKYVEVFVSDDGSSYKSVGKEEIFLKDTLTMGYMTVNVAKQTSRYVKVLAKNYGMIPDNAPGAGTKAWLIVDEILID